MAFADQAKQAQAGNMTVPARSRIDNDIQRLRELAESVEVSASRIIGHARLLGYFEPPKEASATPSPVITTLDDAISDLVRKVQFLSGALNVFD